jgi:hypothetical protein
MERKSEMGSGRRYSFLFWLAAGAAIVVAVLLAKRDVPKESRPEWGAEELKQELARVEHQVSQLQTQNQPHALTPSMPIRPHDSAAASIPDGSTLVCAFTRAKGASSRAKDQPTLRVA